MTDIEGLYATEPGALNYVVRLSRTATGTRTYTVGASIPQDQAADPDVLKRLFAIEKAVIADIDGPRRSARASGNGMAAQLRRSIIVEALRSKLTGTPKVGWLTTAEIVLAIPDSRRSQLVADLSHLVNAGLVEVEQSKGRNPSRYRLVVAQGKEGTE